MEPKDFSDLKDAAPELDKLLATPLSGLRPLFEKYFVWQLYQLMYHAKYSEKGKWRHVYSLFWDTMP